MTILDLLTLTPRAIADAIIIGAVLIMPEVRQYQRNAQIAAEREDRYYRGGNLAGSKLKTSPVQNSKPAQFTLAPYADE